MSEPAKIDAHCARCDSDYTVYVSESNTKRWAKLQAGAAATTSGPVVHDCYSCSLKNGRRPWIWVPAAGLFVFTFPLLYMVWSHIVGPLLVFAAAGYYIWEWFSRKFGTGRPQSAERNEEPTPEHGAREAAKPQLSAR
jgi:hypothetical protein